MESLTEAVQDEENKFFIKKNADEHKYNLHDALLRAVETRRLHMIERGKYVIKTNLTIFFQPINHIRENIK